MPLDYLGERASNHKLINLIVSFWKKRGYSVKAWVEKTTDHNNSTIYVVRTNIQQSCLNINPRHTVI